MSKSEMCAKFALWEWIDRYCGRDRSTVNSFFPSRCVVKTPRQKVRFALSLADSPLRKALENTALLQSGSWEATLLANAGTAFSFP